MLCEMKIIGLKVLGLAIVAPLIASSLLYIVGKIETAWQLGDKRKKFIALTMLVIFFAISFGWLL